MSEKDWLDAATEKIRFGPDRKAVRQELEAHLEDLTESSGLAEEAALQAMGNPEEIAAELGRLHSPWSGYLWRMSQVMVIGAAVVYCLLLLMLFNSGRSYLLPGWKLYNYLTWDGRSVLEIQEVLSERELPSSEIVKTGGITIRVDRAVLLQADGDEAQRDLYLDLNANLGWRGDRLDWYAISDARDHTGAIGPYNWQSISWAHRQKIAVLVYNLSEEAEWVELDFGYGELRRTLHIDLTEEVGA